MRIKIIMVFSNRMRVDGKIWQDLDKFCERSGILFDLDKMI